MYIEKPSTPTGLCLGFCLHIWAPMSLAQEVYAKSCHCQLYFRLHIISKIWIWILIHLITSVSRLCLSWACCGPLSEAAKRKPSCLSSVIMIRDPGHLGIALVTVRHPCNFNLWDWLEVLRQREKEFLDHMCTVLCLPWLAIIYRVSCEAIVPLRVGSANCKVNLWTNKPWKRVAGDDLD